MLFHLLPSNNLSDVLSAATSRTNLGGTTVGQSLFTLTNPSAISFPRINANNTVDALSASDFRTAIGAGTGAGSVTSVAQSFTGGLISVAGSPVTTSGTLALTVAGTSGGIPYFSSATEWATSAALAANALVIGGGAGTAPATTTTGTGVVTALGVNVGSAGAFVTFNGALGTPSSGTVTNLTGTASININGTVGATTPAAGTFTTLTGTSGSITGLTGLAIRSTGAAFDLTLASSEVLTAGRTFSFNVGDAARTLTLSGNPTLGDWFDQAVKTTSSPTVAALTVTGQITSSQADGTAPFVVTSNTKVTNLHADRLDFWSILGATANRNLTLPDSAVNLTSTGTLSLATITIGTGGVSLQDAVGSTHIVLKSGDTANTGDQSLTLAVNNAARSIFLSGSLSLAGDFTTSGAFAMTLTATGTTSVTLPTSGTLAIVSGNLGTPSALVGTNITGTATGFTSGITNALKSATTTVSVSAATAPTVGQVLTATSDSLATWQTPTGGIPTQITVADEATDTTCFLGFFTAATGDLGPKTNANLAFNSSTGAMGLGVAAPLFRFHSHTDAAANEVVSSSAHTTPIPYFIGRSSRGSLASPTASQNDDILLVVSGRGYGDNAFTTGNRASIIMRTTENWTNSAQGTYIQLSTTAVGTTTTATQLTIGGAGSAFGTATTTAAHLTVRGTTLPQLMLQNSATVSMGATVAATTGVTTWTGAGTTPSHVFTDSITMSERLTLSKHFLWDGGRYVTTQFDATTTSLATITGLSCTLVSGKKYAFESWQDVNLAAAGGGKWAISGTATATTIAYHIREETYSVTPTSGLSIRGTALDTSHTVTAVSGSCQLRILGGITCNAGGTFLLQFAQQTASGTSSILVGSWFRVWEVQ